MFSAFHAFGKILIKRLKTSIEFWENSFLVHLILLVSSFLPLWLLLLWLHKENFHFPLISGTTKTEKNIFSWNERFSRNKCACVRFLRFPRNFQWRIFFAEGAFVCFSLSLTGTKGKKLIRFYCNRLSVTHSNNNQLVRETVRLLLQNQVKWMTEMENVGEKVHSKYCINHKQSTWGSPVWSISTAWIGSNEMENLFHTKWKKKWTIRLANHNVSIQYDVCWFLSLSHYVNSFRLILVFVCVFKILVFVFAWIKKTWNIPNNAWWPADVRKRCAFRWSYDMIDREIIILLWSKGNTIFLCHFALRFSFFFLILLVKKNYLLLPFTIFG